MLMAKGTSMRGPARSVRRTYQALKHGSRMQSIPGLDADSVGTKMMRSTPASMKRRSTWAVFAHVLRLFIEAGVDRIIFVPTESASRPGILCIREPCFNAWYVLLTDLAGPRMLVPLAMSIHLKQVPDQLASHARVWLDFPQQVPCCPVFEGLRVPLDTGRDFHI